MDDDVNKIKDLCESFVDDFKYVKALLHILNLTQHTKNIILQIIKTYKETHNAKNSIWTEIELI